MFKPSDLTRDASNRVLDLLVLSLALPVAYRVYEGFSWVNASALPGVEDHAMALVLILALWGAIAWATRVYERPLPRSLAGDAARVAWSLGLVLLAAVAVAFFAKHREFPRLLTALYFAIALALLLGHRAVSRMVGRVPGSHRRRYAVVGSGGLAREVVEAVCAHPEWDMEFAGFVRLDGREEAPAGGPRLGTISQLGRILEEAVIDQVVFAVPREHLGAIEPAVEVCDELGIDVQISLDLLRFGQSRMSIGELDGVPMLQLTRTPSDQLALALKRLFDVVVSAAVLVLMAPVFALVAIAIRRDSPGPVFFRQQRVGLNGRAFAMLKFRSMYQDAEARLAELRAKNEMSGPVFKMTNDPRITRVGKFLRRTSLDEFPQFWNVLRGDMSIVGPRPPLPSEVRQYKRWQRRRLSVKPGITCIWQISGRNEIDFDRWMELDLEYIDGWSLWGDIQICLKTIPAVLSSRGAH